MAIRETPRRRMKPEQAHKLIELIDSDPDAYMKAQGNNVISFDEKGRQIQMPLAPKRAYYEHYSAE